MVGAWVNSVLPNVEIERFLTTMLFDMHLQRVSGILISDKYFDVTHNVSCISATVINLYWSVSVLTLAITYCWH